MDEEIIIPEDLAIKQPDRALLKIINNRKFNDNVLFETQSDFHDISVVENEVGRFLHFKDTYQAGFIYTDFYRGNLPYINYFLLSYFLNKKIEKILLIGMGTGKIVNDFEKLFSALKSIDVVDIEENIEQIAKKYFSFSASDKYNFYLQDALIFLRESKKKYDLIVVDVANDDGIDARFISEDYFAQVKRNLKKGGIFVSNLCSSAQLNSPKNKFFKSVLAKYKSHFCNVDIFKGDYSDEVYYKSFFDIEERVIDITNAIIFASDKNSFNNLSELSQDDEKVFQELGIDVKNYLKDFTIL